MTQEVLKLALEALEGSIAITMPKIALRNKAITAIKEALAQPELCKYGQEPKSCTSSPMDCQCAIDAALAQPEQEPVAWLSTDSIGERHLCFDKPLDNDPVQPLYTTPPQLEERNFCPRCGKRTKDIHTCTSPHE